MATGTVKWFNPTKGYGFVQPQSGGKDVFVHISAVERAGLSTLNEGAVIEYEVVANKGKESAENIKVKQLQRPLRNEKPCLIGGAFIYAADSSDDPRRHARQRRANARRVVPRLPSVLTFIVSLRRLNRMTLARCAEWTRMRSCKTSKPWFNSKAGPPNSSAAPIYDSVSGASYPLLNQKDRLAAVSPKSDQRTLDWA